jgi:hypothetical protein
LGLKPATTKRTIVTITNSIVRIIEMELKSTVLSPFSLMTLICLGLGLSRVIITGNLLRFPDIHSPMQKKHKHVSQDHIDKFGSINKLDNII